MQHRQIIEMVATYFGVDYKVIEEGVIDFNNHITLLESLTTEGGRRAIVFFYQELPPPPIGTSFAANFPRGQIISKIHFSQSPAGAFRKTRLPSKGWPSRTEVTSRARTEPL